MSPPPKRAPLPGVVEELTRIERDLRQLDEDFLKDRDRLNRGVYNGDDFVHSNIARRGCRKALEKRRDALIRQREKASEQETLMRTLPVIVRSFVADVPDIDPREAKVQLQSIVKAVQLHRDRHIEVEFRL